MSGAPCATRSPDFTKICVIWPSICGWTVVDRNDFNVATYSLVSSTGDITAAFNVTGVGGICGGPLDAACWPRLHACAAHIAANAATPQNVRDNMTGWTLEMRKRFQINGTGYFRIFGSVDLRSCSHLRIDPNLRILGSPNLRIYHDLRVLRFP